MVRAWKLDEETTDAPPTSPHQKSPNEAVDIKSLEKIGIFYRKLNTATDYQKNPELLKYCEERQYSFSDILTVSKEGLKNYEETLKCFYKEHFHPDDESRYVLEGSGYFDVRDENDEWVRLFIESGDLITLPSGMYHRFALDDNAHYLKSVRLFIADPIWTPLYRPCDDHFCRLEYVKKYNLKI